MPLPSVWAGPPVFDVVSSVPGISGAAGAAAVIAADVATAAVEFITFSLAEYALGTRGGPVATYPDSVTLAGTVERKGAPTLTTGSGPDSVLRPQAETTFEITVTEDPGVLLGRPLATNDLARWAGFNLLTVGPAVPQLGSYLIKAVLTT